MSSSGGKASKRPRGIVGTAFLAAALIPLVLAGYGLLVEPGRLVLEEAALELRAWPAALPPVRVAVLTDLHVGSPHNGLANLARVVHMTNDAKPDLVLICGDYVAHVMGGRKIEPEPIAAELAKLRSRLGVFSVLGNHDWWDDGPRIRKALREIGRMTVLEDQATPVRWGPGQVWIGGVSDLWTRAHDVARTLRSVPDKAPVVLFTHNPDLFPEVPGRVALTIAGHHHGGQIRLPLLGPIRIYSRYGNRYAAGHVVEDGRHLFVGTGIGTSIVPIRLGVPPQVLVLRLAPRT